MTMTKTWSALCGAAFGLGLAGAAGLVSAAPFTDVDADGDGMLTREEFVAAYPEATEDLWLMLDQNGDEGLSEDEHQAAIDGGLLPAG